MEPVGLSAFTAAVHRALLRQAVTTIEQVAAAVSAPPERVADTLAELRGLGLIEPPRPDAPHELVAADPRIGLAALVRTRQSELDRVAGVIDELSVEFREARLRSDAYRLVEVVEGSTAIAQRMSELLHSAREEILNLYAPPFVTPNMTGRDEAAKIDDGVEIRVLYSAEAFAIDGLLDRVFADVAAGEQARVLPAVPLKLVIVDRRWALLPLTSTEEGTRGSAVLVHQSRLTDALVSLFGALWQQAAPISPAVVSATAEAELPAVDAQLLRLLDVGLKDEAIARHLGLSERTLRRRITLLLQRLGASSRFQAGAQAVRRGWL